MQSKVDGATRLAALAATNGAALFFGAASLFGRLGIAPVWLVAGRCVFAALTIFVLMRARGQAVRVAKGQGAQLGASAVLLAIHWVLFFYAAQEAGVAVAVLTFASFPLCSIIFAALALRRGPRFLELVSAAAIIFAVATIARADLPAGSPAREGYVAGLGSAMSFALYTQASGVLVRRSNALSVAFFQYLAAAAFLAPLLPFSPRPLGGSAWAAIAALGVIGTALAHQLFLYGLARLPGAVCSAIVSLEPVYAIFLAFAVFRTPMPPATALSALVIVGASWLLLRTSTDEEASLSARRARPVNPL